jgi:hypothetical protein
VSDEVYDGIRCAVCEQQFRPGEIGVTTRGLLGAGRMHDDAPDGCHMARAAALLRIAAAALRGIDPVPPGVAEAVAQWLESAAVDAEQIGEDVMATAVARAIIAAMPGRSAAS